ncbi:MAG: hypothetical protein KDA92_18300 [Planctomycetales bacterium]|nr:hypothetical protein [Planctomycetales bacterium]
MEIASTPTAKDSKDQFLHLLVTQLQHQDPLSPMQQEDFLSQLAQFSSLEGIEKLNTNIAEQTKLQSDSFMFQQVSQSASLVGKQVTYQGKTAVGLPVTRTGVVESVTVEDKSVRFKIGEDSIELSQVLSIAASGTTGVGSSTGSSGNSDTGNTTNDSSNNTDGGKGNTDGVQDNEFVPSKTPQTPVEANLDANGTLRRTRGGSIRLSETTTDEIVDDTLLRRSRDAMSNLDSIINQARIDGTALRRTRDTISNIDAIGGSELADPTLDFRRMRGIIADDVGATDADIENMILRRIRIGQ